MTRATDALERLHTTLVDACAGYAEGIDLSDDAGLKELFAGLLEMHAAHAEALAVVLSDEGVETDREGSALQLVHKAVLNVRAALTGLDEKVLPAIRDGEARILARYDEAIQEVGGDPELEALVAGQRALAAERMRGLRLAHDATA